MNTPLRVSLDGTPDQSARLHALQIAFADVCNAIAPVVQQTRCWNRVALHHLVYHPMRERFPEMGSQMICNAIYSVCRSARLILQHPKSPWSVAKRPGAPLPLLRFASNAPVYFDRHTLSLRGTALSMFTLDGRMRFNVGLAPDDAARFHAEKLMEVMLVSTQSGFDLYFEFAEAVSQRKARPFSTGAYLPDHVHVVPPSASSPQERGSLQTTDAQR